MFYLECQVINWDTFRFIPNDGSLLPSFELPLNVDLVFYTMKRRGEDKIIFLLCSFGLLVFYRTLQHLRSIFEVVHQLLNRKLNVLCFYLSFWHINTGLFSFLHYLCTFQRGYRLRWCLFRVPNSSDSSKNISFATTWFLVQLNLRLLVWKLNFRKPSHVVVVIIVIFLEIYLKSLVFCSIAPSCCDWIILIHFSKLIISWVNIHFGMWKQTHLVWTWIIGWIGFNDLSSAKFSCLWPHL